MTNKENENHHYDDQQNTIKLKITVVPIENWQVIIGECFLHRHFYSTQVYAHMLVRNYINVVGFSQNQNILYDL